MIFAIFLLVLFGALPFAASGAEQEHGIPKERVVQKTYPGDHKMYLYLPSLQQLSEDIGAFIEKR